MKADGSDKQLEPYRNEPPGSSRPAAHDMDRIVKERDRTHILVREK